MNYGTEDDCVTAAYVRRGGSTSAMSKAVAVARESVTDQETALNHLAEPKKSENYTRKTRISRNTNQELTEIQESVIKQN